MGILDFLVNILFPPRCLICGRPSDSSGLCEDCRGEYVRELFEKCPVCGKSPSDCTCGTEFLTHTRTTIGTKGYCALCWYKSKSNGREEERVTERMIYSLKQRGLFADFFADELCRCLTNLFDAAGESFDGWILTYTPRSAEKYMECGVDQSEEIGRRLAKKLGIRFVPMFDRDEGREQKNLNAKQRMENAEDSLIIREKKITPGGKYLLLDDIITSGATMTAASKLLYFYGAGAVYPVAVARTMPKRYENKTAL